MHIKDKYNIGELWQPHPENRSIRMPVQKYNNIVDDCNGVLNIFGDLYGIHGDSQEDGMITMTVRKIF